MHVNLPQEPIWVHADPVRLAQVFINLLNNACKFTEAGGTISISAERQGGDATVSVKDTGIGIAPDKLEGIFEMFAQVDQSLERTRGGLGIGLTIVKRLVELHGGQISVRSEGPGHGSEFIVRLPVLAEGNATAPVAAKSNEAATKPRRILVTDDNRDAATSLALLLRHGGHAVEMAYDGRQAIEKAEVWRPDVMLLDLGMPEMNGYDVCRAIRQTAWGKDIQIVALTGWGQEQDRRNTREAGFDSHLVKPVDLAVLGDVLATDAFVRLQVASSQSTARNRTNDKERFCTCCDFFWQRRVGRVVGEILLAGVEADEVAPLAGGVVADGAAEHGVAGFEGVEDGAQRDGSGDVELHFAGDAGEGFQVVGDDDADHVKLIRIGARSASKGFRAVDANSLACAAGSDRFLCLECYCPSRTYLIAFRKNSSLSIVCLSPSSVNQWRRPAFLATGTVRPASSDSFDEHQALSWFITSFGSRSAVTTTCTWLVRAFTA